MLVQTYVGHYFQVHSEVEQIVKGICLASMPAEMVGGLRQSGTRPQRWIPQSNDYGQHLNPGELAAPTGAEGIKQSQKLRADYEKLLNYFEKKYGVPLLPGFGLVHMVVDSFAGAEVGAEASQ